MALKEKKKKHIFREAAYSYPKEKGSWHEVICTSVNSAWNPEAKAKPW